MKQYIFYFCFLLLFTINSAAYAAYEEKLVGPTQGSQVPHVEIIDGAEETSPPAHVVEKSLPDAYANNSPVSLSSAQQVQPLTAGVQEIGKGFGSRVNSKGNMPFRHAVVLLIPHDWSGTVANDIALKKVQWEKHENWVKLLEKICRETNAAAIINWETKSVSIKSFPDTGTSIPAKSKMVRTSARLDAQPVAVPVPPVLAKPLPPHTVPPYSVRASATAAHVAKRNNIPVATFCRWNEVSPSERLPKGYRVHLQQPAHVPVASPILPTPSAVESAPVASTPQEALPLPVQDTKQSDAKEDTPTPSLPESAPIPTWTITPGNLQAQVSAWSAQANYQLLWKTQNDFEMESHARFQGDFLDAIRQLFTGLQRSGHALRVTLYQGNNVLEVSEE